MDKTVKEFNQFDLIPDGHGEYVATHNATGREFRSVTTGGDFGCTGCYFDDRHHDANKTGACHSLPCSTSDWPDKCSRVWFKI